MAGKINRGVVTPLRFDRNPIEVPHSVSGKAETFSKFGQVACPFLIFHSHWNEVTNPP